ncbi:MAG: YbaB/EbfC family nucleoid-associated protein [Bacteroidota bacterium]
MFGKLAEAQQKAEEIKNRLALISVEGETEGGLVKVSATGNKNITQIHIDNSLMKPERKEELEDLLMVAIERAMQQAENVSAAEMKNLMGSMMPGLGGLFGK